MNIPAFLVYCAIIAVTPGPNTLMSLYLGASGGSRFWRFLAGSMAGLLVKPEARRGRPALRRGQLPERHPAAGPEREKLGGGAEHLFRVRHPLYHRRRRHAAGGIDLHPFLRTGMSAVVWLRRGHPAPLPPLPPAGEHRAGGHAGAMRLERGKIKRQAKQQGEIIPCTRSSCASWARSF